MDWTFQTMSQDTCATIAQVLPVFALTLMVSVETTAGRRQPPYPTSRRTRLLAAAFLGIFFASGEFLALIGTNSPDGMRGVMAWWTWGTLFAFLVVTTIDLIERVVPKE